MNNRKRAEKLMQHCVRILVGPEATERIIDSIGESALSAESIQVRSIVQTRFSPLASPQARSSSPSKSAESPSGYLSVLPERKGKRAFKAVAAATVFTRRTRRDPSPDDASLPDDLDFNKIHNFQLRGVVRHLVPLVTVKYDPLLCRKFLGELEAVYPRRNTREAAVLAKMKDRVREVVQRWRLQGRLRKKDVREVLEFVVAVQDTR